MTSSPELVPEPIQIQNDFPPASRRKTSQLFFLLVLSSVIILGVVWGIFNFSGWRNPSTPREGATNLSDTGGRLSLRAYGMMLDGHKVTDENGKPIWTIVNNEIADLKTDDPRKDKSTGLIVVELEFQVNRKADILKVRGELWHTARQAENFKPQCEKFITLFSASVKQ